MPTPDCDAGPGPAGDLDRANREPFDLIYSLRQSIDVYRVVGLNADALNARGIGAKKFAWDQRMAFAEIPSAISKVLERETMGYRRNSIPGIIRLLSLRPPPRRTKPRRSGSSVRGTGMWALSAM